MVQNSEGEKGYAGKVSVSHTCPLAATFLSWEAAAGAGLHLCRLPETVQARVSEGPVFFTYAVIKFFSLNHMHPYIFQNQVPYCLF